MFGRMVLVSMLVAGCGVDDSLIPQPDAGTVEVAPPAPCDLPPMKTVGTLAGCSEPGIADGARGSSRFDNPTMTGTIWRIDPVAHTGVVIARDLGRPRGLAVLADGRIAMADYTHHVVTLLDPQTGTQTPLAGMFDIPGHANGLGRYAQFAQPYDLVVL